MNNTLTKQQLKILSDRILERYEEKTCKNIALMKSINPTRFAADTLGLKVRYENLSLDGKVLGITSIQPTAVVVYDLDGMPEPFELDGYTILIDASLMMTSNAAIRNFTIAHEYAHQILSRMYPSEDEHEYVYRVRKNPVSQANNWKEWQADVLASYILMPDILIERKLKNLHMGIITDLKLEELAKAFRVSKTAMKIRLLDKGYKVGEENLNIAV